MDHDTCLLSHNVSFRGLGGPCEIDFSGIENPEKFSQIAIDEVKRIEVKFSRYREDSVISQINSNAGGDWVKCDKETLQLIDYAQQLHQYSNGLFDITSGVLRKVWDFKSAKIPTQSEIKEILPLIGLQKLERKDESVRLRHKDMQIDLGGIGKEYAVDRVAALLFKQGIGLDGHESIGFQGASALINFGGDVRALNAKPDGRAWQIGIQDPRKPEVCFANVNLSQGALTTSGDYERFLEVDGKRFCHILNPFTGLPVSYWRSITVLAPLASIAGATSTVAMLLEERAIPYLRDSGFAYLAVDCDGVVHRNAYQ